MKYQILLFFILCSCGAKVPGEYVLGEKDIVPEGIAYSQKKDVFYLTSVAKSKIIVVDRKTGMQNDFIKEHEFGYAPGAGIYVDDEHHLLYAIGGYFMVADSLSAVYSFDLNTKKLLNRYTVNDEGDHFLNDLVMDRKGVIYVTDTKGSSVYVLYPGRNSLELFFNSPEIKYPNGIAISDDNNRLYIASGPKGIRILDISSKKILNGADSAGISQGIDGLEFYKNHLYAIQNGVERNTFNFRKLILNKAQDSITDVEIIDSHTPRLDVPLTFCLAKGKAVVIANSNLQYLDQKNFKFSDADTVLKTKLLEYSID